MSDERKTPEVVDPLEVAKKRIKDAQAVLKMIGLETIRIDMIETIANVNAVAMVLVEKGLATREELDLRAARAHAEFLENTIKAAMPRRTS
jgi:hypothetical protein